MAEPTATGTFTRRQAPEGEVSSSLAAEVWRVPNLYSRSFDHRHHGGSGFGSDCAHTVSLYRQEMEVVQGCFGVSVERWSGTITSLESAFRHLGGGDDRRRIVLSSGRHLFVVFRRRFLIRH